ncbi:hypothetical protein JTE90_012379 [Oedothorax gibbosus]|uniref:Uncharacterized protein n=1 Tax=Oedothorax gibbosus TaxID=931172 RepID=A0AAV6TNP2_9ARAC|nr:hypothetical protein JTE90_012379 [Oedothorax gibbosus]
MPPGNARSIIYPDRVRHLSIGCHLPSQRIPLVVLKRLQLQSPLTKRPIPSYTPELEYPPNKKATKEPKLPFCKRILPNRSEIVDVYAAFGSDYSFLPRPLTPPEPEDITPPEPEDITPPEPEDTPPEPEDTVSEEEIESFLAELAGETEGNAADEPQPSSSITSSFISWLSDVAQGATPLPIETTLPTVAPVQLPTVTTQDRPSPFQPSRIETAEEMIEKQRAVRALYKSIGIETNTQVSPTKSTFITVPSSSISTSSSLLTGIRTQGGKMIQLVSKRKDKEQTSQPQTFQTNLSLLSDDAGMRKAEATATLVKLDRPSPFQSLKGVKVIKSTSSPPSRVKTAEEVVEKQLAIQALNKSNGIESTSNLGKEPGYSICYPKPDGSIVSWSVTWPSYPGLTSQG